MEDEIKEKRTSRKDYRRLKSKMKRKERRRSKQVALSDNTKLGDNSMNELKNLIMQQKSTAMVLHRELTELHSASITDKKHQKPQ
jgi:hypothetical protein